MTTKPSSKFAPGYILRESQNVADRIRFLENIQNDIAMNRRVLAIAKRVGVDTSGLDAANKDMENIRDSFDPYHQGDTYYCQRCREKLSECICELV